MCARQTKKSKELTVSFPLRFCMLSVLLFVGRRCSGPILTLVESRSFFRGRYGYLYNTIYLAPGPRATIAVARRPRQLGSKEISAVTIDYRRVKGRETIGVERFGTYTHTYIHICIMPWQRPETWTHAASSGLNRQLTDSM